MLIDCCEGNLAGLMGLRRRDWKNGEGREG